MPHGTFQSMRRGRMNGVAHTALIWLKALLCPDVKSDGTPRTAAYWRDNLPYWIPHDKTIAAKAEVALESR